MDEDNNPLREEILKKAKSKALHILERSDKTELQLKEKLLEADFPEDIVEEAMDYVRSFHYLDDRRYAEHYVRAKAGTKSRFQLLFELQDKGVDREITEEVISAAEEEGELDEKEAVKKQFLKKYAAKDLSDPALYQKAVRYFSGKGYSYDAIKEGISAAIEVS